MLFGNLVHNMVYPLIEFKVVRNYMNMQCYHVFSFVGSPISLNLYSSQCLEANHTSS